MDMYSLRVNISNNSGVLRKDPVTADAISIVDCWRNVETAKSCSKDILKNIIGKLDTIVPSYANRAMVKPAIDDMIRRIDNFKSDRIVVVYSFGSMSFQKITVEDPTMAWIPCSERLPNERDCNNTNLFIVTIEYQRTSDSKRYRHIDTALINSDFDEWLTKEKDKVVAWLPQIDIYMDGLNFLGTDNTAESINPVLLQAWNSEKVVEENSQKSYWLDKKELSLTRNAASYSKPISDKRLHIYFNSQDIPNEVDCIACTLDGMSEAIERGEPIIHTTQIIYCSNEMIYKYGYNIIIHPSAIESFVIDKNGCTKPNKNITEDHNLLKMLMTGSFCDMSKYTF